MRVLLRAREVSTFLGLYIMSHFKLELKIAFDKWEVGFRKTAANCWVWQEKVGDEIEQLEIDKS